MAKPKMVKLTSVIRTEQCQIRLRLNLEVIGTYREGYLRGDDFPPIVVFEDPKTPGTYYIGDGMQRAEARRLAGFDDIKADVRQGDIHDAQVYAAGANHTHGLKVTPAEKERGILFLLRNPRSKNWSVSLIAQHVKCSDAFAAKCIDRSGEPPRKFVVGKNGQVFEAGSNKPKPLTVPELRAVAKQAAALLLVLDSCSALRRMPQLARDEVEKLRTALGQNGRNDRKKAG